MPPISTTIKKIKDLISGTEQSFNLTQEFQDCINSMENTALNLFITGYAGTGKSTLIDYFRNTTKKKAVILAPTGLAAINVRGQTIHSFFHLPPRFLDPNTPPRRSNSRIYRDLDVIIIDEISMVRADIFDGLDRFLRVNGKDKNLPFGGIQMIVVGDLYQLPPIVSREEMHIFHHFFETPYFFSSNAYQSGEFSVIELTHIFRQKDEKFISLLNKVRIGDITTQDMELINNRIVTKDYEKVRREFITLATTNSVVSAINDSELNKIDQPLFTYLATVEGNFPTEDRILPVDLELKLKKGARVIFIKNDKGRRWVNGTSGIIHDLDKNLIKVKLDEEGFHDIVTVPIEEWENVKYEFDEEEQKVIPISLGKLKQYPLKLAWAITIHKSQGMTFNKANIDFSKSPFTHGQTYVALSRCRTLEGMVVTKKIYPNDVMVDPRIVEFSKKIYRM
ncbi:MAG: AAA family ATPase [Candidatus Levybacteria bacterium]|nr:AAA family ATPase [Candidatus Levybacteria bacterium]